jgi:excisionase family DNA binding protein
LDETGGSNPLRSSNEALRTLLRLRSAFCEVKEAAEFLGTTLRETYNLISRRQIPFYRVGKRGVRFRRFKFATAQPRSHVCAPRATARFVPISELKKRRSNPIFGELGQR